MASRKRNRGFKKIVGRKGKLHRELGVPEDKPIPPGKKAAALAGKYGAEAKADAQRAFRGVLKAGRQTVARNAAKRKARSRISIANNNNSSSLYKLAEKRIARKRKGR